MDAHELTKHLWEEHGVDQKVAEEVIGMSPDLPPEHLHAWGDFSYLRGYHDGLHNRIDADDAVEGH